MSEDNRKEKKKSGKTAAEAAYAYLAPRMRTVAEVRKHLNEKGYDPDEITDTVNELIGMRYLDDYQYALRYYEYNREKRRGSGRAARELLEKGVDAETVRYAREDFLFTGNVDEYADALSEAEKEISLRCGPASAGTGSGEEAKPAVMDDKLAARIGRKLDGKGFDRNDIFKVIDELRHRYGKE